MFKQDKYGDPSNWFKLLGMGLEGLRTRTRSSYPCLYGLIFLEQKDYRFSKGCVGLLFGLILGLMFYECILLDMAFEMGTIYYLGAIITLIISAGCAVSSQIRCITLLTIPTFSGKAGRHIVQALIVSSILMGPMANIIDNMEEVMRMYTCSNSMAYNLSQARYNLLVKPFKIAFLGTRVDTDELKDMLGSVNNVVEPFAQEIEGVDDMKFIQEENDYMDSKLNDTKRSEELENKYRVSKKSKRSEDPSLNNTNHSADNTTDKEAANAYQQKYFKKLETRCENVKTGMSQMCKKRFDKFKEQCEDAVHWAIAWAVCWPMKLDVICDLVKMFTYGSYDCDPQDDVSTGIGEGYVKLKKSGETMKSGISEERTHYRLIKPPNFVGLYSAVTITKEFTHEIYTTKSYADALLSIVKTMLAFMFIMVIRSATNYHNNFIRFTDFDNKYVTADFRILDAKRHALGLTTLLPLTKTERKQLVDPYSLYLADVESAAWNKEFIVVCAMVIVCCVVCGIDWAIWELLSWINNNLEFSYTESGYHSFKIEVEGIGFVASIVRSIIKSFDFKKVLDGVVTNKPCLPKPTSLNQRDYLRLFGSCAILCAMSYGEGYVKRLRRAICAFYYRHQEKRRIEILYKKTMVYRKQLIGKQLDVLYKKAKKNAVMADLRMCYLLRNKYPTWFNWLRCCGWARPLCVVCGEEESCRGPSHHQCRVCKSFICLECWNNFNSTCYICETRDIIKKKSEGNMLIED